VLRKAPIRKPEITESEFTEMGKPRLLITGARGLIGQILMPHLGCVFDVCGLDIAPSISDSLIRQADISNEDQVRAVFDEFSPVDYVLHLAANSSAAADWKSVLMSNIHGTWNVFSIASQNKVKRVVFASSNHTTGYYEGIPPTLHRQPVPPTIRVNDPIRPDGPYGISKIAGEAVARYFYDCNNLEAVCLRIGSVLKDDNPTNEERLSSTWLSHQDLKHLIRRALLTEEFFSGFGIYYGVSRNGRRFWDISNAKIELGYHPVDDALIL
jgi:nucleoside-diphosphate-sugar epimerase